jgi:hypothetical protein
VNVPDAGSNAPVTANRSAQEFKGLSVTGVIGTFEVGIAQLEQPLSEVADATLVLFLGSTIGNLEPDTRRELLQALRSRIRAGDAFLLGADSIKSESILIPAYDDPLEVTAAFNRNLLVRINRELGGMFDLDTFGHFARYNAELHRIEMNLVSSIAQRVRIPGAKIEVEFVEGESIHTENSYKFSSEMIATLAHEAGFTLKYKWTDADARDDPFLLARCLRRVLLDQKTENFVFGHQRAFKHFGGVPRAVGHRQPPFGCARTPPGRRCGFTRAISNWPVGITCNRVRAGRRAATKKAVSNVPLAFCLSPSSQAAASPPWPT